MWKGREWNFEIKMQITLHTPFWNLLHSRLKTLKTWNNQGGLGVQENGTFSFSLFVEITFIEELLVEELEKQIDTLRRCQSLEELHRLYDRRSTGRSWISYCKHSLQQRPNQW